MANKYYFYPGTDYGLDPSHGMEPYLGKPIAQGTSTSEFALTTDVRTANQLQALSNVLSTGAKTAEVQMTFPQVADVIPQQHLKEINRLRKLVGAELTLHGPVVEPTGVTKQGWSEAERMQAERQMWNAVERGHELNPDGNIVITFHASAGLPELKERAWEKPEGAEKAKEVVKEFWAIDEIEGGMKSFKLKKDPFVKEEPTIEETLKKENRNIWDKTLYQVNFHMHNGARSQEVIESLKSEKGVPDELKARLEKEDLTELYRLAKTQDGQKLLGDLSPHTRAKFQEAFQLLNYNQSNIDEAYNEVHDLFNIAYQYAKRKNKTEDLARLDSFAKEVQQANSQGILTSPEKMDEYANLVGKGVNLLSTIEKPQILQPFQDFAINKASDTFSNIAFEAYKKFGYAQGTDTTPIISIENPPAGGALSRAEDLNKLIEEARHKFAKKASEEFGMSESDAKKQAEKIIGATWDVGHINMIRKFGYPTEQVIKETEAIAEKVKHIHLSDNFGYEHTELPMGMGNVPTKEIFEKLGKKAEAAKKVIETGNWYEHFKTSPLRETFAAFGSPIYPMKAAASWYQAADVGGTYFAGYGLNPEQHHSLYGAGFSNLPVELGGQMAGRSRVSGAPIE